MGRNHESADSEALVGAAFVEGQVPFEVKAVASLAALYAFRMLGLFMVLPVLSLYGDSYTGSTPLLIGLALGIYGFSQAILQIPFGILSDRIGRKPVIAGGLLLFAVGSVVAANSDSIYGLILGRCLQGSGAIASAIMALAADLTSEENRTKAMAAIGVSIGISFSIALVLGPVVSAMGGMDAIFWLTAVLALLGMVILFKVVPSPQVLPRQHRDAGAVPGLLRKTAKHVELQRLNFGIFALHFVLMATFVVLPQVLELNLGIEREQHWKVYLPMLLLSFVAMLPFMVIAEKKRQLKPVFIGAIALLGVMELGFAWWQHSVVLTLMGVFFFFMAFNLLEATLPSLVSKVAPAGSKGTAIGIYSSSQFFGAFVGAVTGGWLMENSSIAAVFDVCAALVFLWVVVAGFMHPPKFLSSVLVPLNDVDCDATVERLRGLAGVEEVVVIAEEHRAYLKVDNRIFDRSSIATKG